MKVIVRIIATALATALAAWLIPGIELSGSDNTERALTLLGVAVIIGLVNAVVKPVATVVGACLVLLTLGLFLLVINALMLMLSSWLAGQLNLGFNVDGFWPALWGSIVISVVSGLIYAIFRPREDKASERERR